MAKYPQIRDRRDSIDTVMRQSALISAAKQSTIPAFRHKTLVAGRIYRGSATGAKQK
jgi:hypothetical protein